MKGEKEERDFRTNTKNCNKDDEADPGTDEAMVKRMIRKNLLIY